MMLSYNHCRRANTIKMTFKEILNNNFD